MQKTIVSMIKCTTYQQSVIRSAIKDLLEPLGGIEAFVKPGFRVLLKPNMLTSREPDKASTTHPAIVEEIARMCVNAGAKVLIGDSPPAVFGRTEEYWKNTGFLDAAKNSGAEMISFETDQKASITFFSNGKSLTTPVVKSYFMADLVINLPKMKTHNLTRITGAVKNLFGLVPGLIKAGWHKAYPRPIEFSNFMSDLAHQLPCGLTILDGITAMDGQGPAGGRVVNAGVLIASTCPVAVDMAFCHITGLDHRQVPMLQRCRQLNWGPEDLDQIELRGTPADHLKISDYRVPGLPPIAFLPDFLINILSRLFWAGPRLISGKCIRCGKCRRICPVDAITAADKGIEFDRQKCISCFCCMEVCPVDAIEMKSSPLVSITMKLRKFKRKLRKKKNK